MSAKSFRHRCRSAHSADGPAVVPQQGRPDRRVGGIEQSDAQHLARQADAAHGRHRRRRLVGQGVEAVDDAPATNPAAPARTTAARGWERASGALAMAAGRSSSSMTTALTLDVPMSMPRYIEGQPVPRRMPSTARAATSSTTRTEHSLARRTPARIAVLFKPPEATMDRGDVAQHLDRCGDHAPVERMLHGLAPRIEEGAHDVADGAGGAQRIDGDVARQAVADQERAAAEIADAQQRHVVGGQPLEGLLEHVLVQDGVARARAAGIDRRRQVVALAVDAAGEFAGDLEGVELEPVGQAAHHGIDAELGEIAGAQMADGLAQRGAPADAQPAHARLAEMPRQVFGGGAAQDGRDLVLIGRGRNHHGVLQAGLLDQLPLQLDAVGQPGIDLDIDQAAFPGLAQQAVGAQPRDAELARDIGLGEPLHEIEPGHAHPKLLVILRHPLPASCEYPVAAADCHSP